MTMKQKQFQTIETLLAAGRKMTRREFIRNAAILGISVSAASGLWSKTVKAAEPKKGGHFVLGMGHGSTTDSLDPATQENFYATNFGFTRHNHIAEISPEGKLIPELAESWEATPDAKTWHFKVRRGVEFHNGQTIEANDFVVSINHHRSEDSKSPARALLKPVVDIKTDGKHAFTIKLDSGDAGRHQNRRQARIHNQARQRRRRLSLHHQRLSYPRHADQGR
jgi:peptide/nickel transport system substrate-binding protein